MADLSTSDINYPNCRQSGRKKITQAITDTRNSNSKDIISLLPGLTELVCALGCEDNLKGRSHECDYPPSMADLPVLTSPKYAVEPGQSGKEIHESVTGLLQKALSIYEVDDELLIKLSPELILTQDHCKVCAVSIADLKASVIKSLGSQTEVVSVSPTDLESIFRSFITIASYLNIPERGVKLTNQIKHRFDEIRELVKKRPRPEVIAIEWMDPLMTGGNWMPEMIDIAGGINCLSEAGKHSPWMEWDKIKQADPDILLVLPCGYPIEKSLSEIEVLETKNSWGELKAVQENQVYILDGNHYFNRPGPRIKESVEILARIFHPDIFENRIDDFGWARYPEVD